MEIIAEEWGIVHGEFGEYEVSNIGNVRRVDTRAAIAVSKEKEGYRVVGLRSAWTGEFKQFRVHRLVAKAFVGGYRNDLSVNHINGIKHDNRAENLEWVTEKENKHHSIRTGLWKMRKLTDEQADEIRKQRKCGVSCIKLAKQYGVSDESVRLIGIDRLYNVRVAV